MPQEYCCRAVGAGNESAVWNHACSRKGGSMQIALASQSPIRQFGRYEATSTASVTQLALQRMVKRELGDLYNDLQHNSLQRLKYTCVYVFRITRQRSQ
jgi:hypothetical protein